MIISGAEPFLLKGGKHGVLLIHGFTGNPAEMMLLGKYLQLQNFTVHGIRLAGHATNEKDLSHMTKFDWLDSVVDGYSILHGICDKVSVIGHSMGGLLALRLGAVPSIKLCKIVTLATPVFIDDSLGLEKLPSREKSIGQYIRKARRHLAEVPIAVNRTYRLMPLISIHELVDLIAEVKLNLCKVSVPIFIIHGDNDHTATIDSAYYIADNVNATEKEVHIIKGAGHLLPIDNCCRDIIFKLSSDFLNDNK